jgi:hypothetical protein
LLDPEGQEFRVDTVVDAVGLDVVQRAVEQCLEFGNYAPITCQRGARA